MTQRAAAFIEWRLHAFFLGGAGVTAWVFYACVCVCF